MNGKISFYKGGNIMLLDLPIVQISDTVSEII
jgi:hypothetical protein